MTMRTVDKYNCEQVFKRLDDYLDRELTPPEMERIRLLFGSSDRGP